jgi:CDP-diacylglycerol--serine O-phosphatidyltransferase
MIKRKRMADYRDKSESLSPVLRILPNAVTLAAICAGLTAIRFAIQDHHTAAVLLVLFAAVLDGLDGRLARRVGCDSELGAELDSLADAINFGVAPALILYFWALEGMGAFGARFNVSSRQDTKGDCNVHFTGVPAPAGACLALAPMFLSFSFADKPILPGVIICLYMLFIGLLMISRIPTVSLKAFKISSENKAVLISGVILLIISLVMFEWVTLVAIAAVYLAMVIKSMMTSGLHIQDNE